MDIKVSKIQATENRAIVQEVGLQYQSYGDVKIENMDDPDVLNTLVKDINRLQKADHAEIYMTIRSTKPANFFATNSLGTHFNIFALDNKVRWEIYRMVQLCKDNNRRQKVMEEFKDLLLTNDTENMPAPESNGGQTEEEKYRKMMKLNA